MSGGEVKRYVPHTYHGGDVVAPSMEENEHGAWVKHGDHERIVAGLKEELEVFRNREYGFENELELKQTIAKQRRVIEMLKESHRKNTDEDFRGNRSTESVRSFITLKEVEALEKEQS